MARPQKYTDEIILKAARRLLLEKGLHVSTQEIADDIGLSQAALFKRFGTKDKLIFAAMVPQRLPDFLLTLQKGLDERPVFEQLNELGQIIGKFFEEMIPIMSVMGQSMHTLLKQGENPPPVRVMLALSNVLREAHAQKRIFCEKPEACATMFIGSLMQRAFLLHLNPKMPLPPIENYVGDVLSLLWAGIAPNSAPSERVSLENTP